MGKFQSQMLGQNISFSHLDIFNFKLFISSAKLVPLGARPGARPAEVERKAHIKSLITVTYFPKMSVFLIVQMCEPRQVTYRCVP